MTDPTGRSFLSYSRKRLDEANLLIHAQREIGIPTWQDVEDLGTAQTEAQLEKDLAAPETANAILYLTPEVAESAYIRRIEAPAIFRRLEAEDDFFLVPVAAGGASRDEAASMVQGDTGLHDLRTWNMLKFQGDGPDPLQARKIAERVLHQRLERIHRRLPEGEPLHISLMARAKPAFQSGQSLVLDWSHHFHGGRLAEPTIWETTLLPALEQVKRAAQQRAPGRALEVSGLPTLSAAAAFGCTFLTLSQISVAWRQPTKGLPDQLFSHDVPAVATDIQPAIFPRDVEDNQDVAILLSVTKDASLAFGATRDLSPMRAIVHLRLPGSKFSRLLITDPGQAVDVANKTIDAMVRARDRFKPERLHLFMAVPAGLAMLIGQSLNTLGPVQIYEYEEVDAVGRYRPATILRAAS